jgi:hypothetical protein
MGLGHPGRRAELTNIDIANVDTAAKAIAENADIAIGVKVGCSRT